MPRENATGEGVAQSGRQKGRGMLNEAIEQFGRMGRTEMATRGRGMEERRGRGEEEKVN